MTPLVIQLQLDENQSNEIVAPLVRQLTDIRETILSQISWTHHLIIFSRTRTEEEREFYIRLCIRERYSKRELDRQISSGTFERVMLGDQKLPTAIKLSPQDISSAFKPGYIFEFLNLPEDHNERHEPHSVAGTRRSIPNAIAG